MAVSVLLPRARSPVPLARKENFNLLSALPGSLPSRFLPGFDECIGTHAETLLRTLRSPWPRIALTGSKGQRRPNESISKNASWSLRKILLRASSRLSPSSRRSATSEAGLPGKYNRLVKAQHRLRFMPGWRPAWERWGHEPNLWGLRPETYAIHAGSDGSGRWITVAGSDERGVLFGVGQLLRLIDFGRQEATIDHGRLPIHSSPKYPLRGHQLGYRPKTNAYDAWTVRYGTSTSATWRSLAPMRSRSSLPGQTMSRTVLSFPSPQRK